MASKKSKKPKKNQPVVAKVAATVSPATSAAPAQSTTDASAATIANPAFATLAAARAQITGLASFTPSTLSRRGSSFVTDKYFSLLLQKVDQNADLQATTGIDTATFRTNLAFINSLSSFPAACQALANDVAIYLDTMLLQMSDDARAATALLAWKAKKSKDTNAAKTVAQLRAMPKGRGVTVPKKKKRAANGTVAAKAAETKGAKKGATTAESAASASPEAPSAAPATAEHAAGSSS